MKGQKSYVTGSSSVYYVLRELSYPRNGHLDIKKHIVWDYYPYHPKLLTRYE
jgi:hypothetical protein